MPKYLSVEQVAETLFVCRETVLRWCREGRLKCYQPGQKVLIAERDLVAFVEGSPVESKGS
jgi:excisionase family DNA binding protein